MNTEATEPKATTETGGQNERLVMCDADYKAFYEENRVALLQYKSLRDNFSKLVDDVLGPDYYNMEMDVYECDRMCCEDIARKSTMSWWERLLNT